MRLLPLLLVLAFALAGCAAAPAAPPATSTPTKQYEDGVNKLDVPTLPRDAPKDGERTLATAPQWRLGEYWQYHLVDGFTGTAYDFTRVVAGTDGPNYLVGFPSDAFSNDILVLHIPGFGDVAQADLSFSVHNVNFAPLKFPLAQTATWPTAFEGRPGNVTVEPQGATATLTGAGKGWTFTATYDPAVGEITKLDYPGYATYEVTRHGYGYTGTVRVPHAHELVFQHGRIAGVLGIAGPLTQPQPQTSVTETVQVEPGFDHLAFVILIGNALGLPAASGYYDEKVVSPNGTAYELSMLPQETPGPAGLKVAFYGTGDPTGPWTLTHTAAGPGLAMAEGIGYHSIDVQLPSGCVVASFNAQHHAAPCKVDARGNLLTQASK